MLRTCSGRCPTEPASLGQETGDSLRNISNLINLGMYLRMRAASEYGSISDILTGSLVGDYGAEILGYHSLIM